MADAGADPPPLGAEADPTPPVHPPTPPITERVQNLFTGRNRNRSNRRDNPDRIDRVESESQAGNEEEEDESDNDWSTEDFVYREFTENDPVGKVMLNLAQDNMVLLKKAGIKASNVNIKALCKSFFLDRHRQPTVNSLVEGSAKMVERMLLEKDLNTHKLNMGIAPPEYFSPTPTLHTAAA